MKGGVLTKIIKQSKSNRISKKSEESIRQVQVSITKMSEEIK